MRSATRLEAFLIKQGMLFFARLQCFRRVRSRARAIERLTYAKALYVYIYSYHVLVDGVV